MFKLLATRSGMLLNTSDLSRSLGIVNMTLKRYLKLLEILFFIHLLPSWFINHGKRITKSPKLHVCDTAILSQLLEMEKDFFMKDPLLLGQFLESFVLEKLDGTIVGIEVKCTKKIRSTDLKGLKYLKSISKNRFKRGIILHFSNQIERIEKDIYSIPIQALWEYI